MIIDSHVDLAGFVASEPSFKRLENGTSTAKLRVAYTERRFSRETGEWADGPTSFVTVLCWRTLADNVAISLRKGEPVVVRGRLRVREYEGKDGSPRIAVEVDASSVGHDLSRGVAHFSRTRLAGDRARARTGWSRDRTGGSRDRTSQRPMSRAWPGQPRTARTEPATACSTSGRWQNSPANWTESQPDQRLGRSWGRVNGYSPADLHLQRPDSRQSRGQSPTCPSAGIIGLCAGWQRTRRSRAPRSCRSWTRNAPPGGSHGTPARWARSSALSRHRAPRPGGAIREEAHEQAA